MSEPAIVETPAAPVAPPPAPEPIESAPSVADHAAQFGPDRDRSDDEKPPVVVPVTRNAQGEFKRPSRAERRTIEGYKKDLEYKVAQLTRERDELKAKQAPASSSTPTIPAPSPVTPSIAPAAKDVPIPPYQKPEPTIKALQEQFPDKDPYELLPKEYRQWERDRETWEKEQQAVTAVITTGLAHRETFAAAINAALPADPELQAAVKTIEAHPLPDTLRLALWGLDNPKEIVKYLAAHPEDLQDALALGERPLSETAVALVSRQLRRFLAPAASGAAATGSSAPAPKAFIAPRPLTPVQTKPMTPAEPPPTDGSLSITEHARHFGPKARR